MKYKIIEKDVEDLFLQIPDNVCDKIGSNYEIALFANIPHIKKTDMLEYFEVMVLSSLDFNGEIGETILATNILFINKGLNVSTQANYADDYIAVIGQLFLGGYIDFYRSMCEYGIEDNTPNLSQYKPNNQYGNWIFLRDNYIYGELYRNGDINPAQGDFWKNSKNWNMYNIDCIRTEKGDKYYNEILAPRFYNKYKDLEVEIDKKGNIIRWIGEINR
ncbi:hypothetical protein [Helicobacter sp. MIT 05-5294]|uniref:hypothetical protein n=1 Tax=Helicobacter sp. MIT 05-5294 TaxID=1548150 RepID=UPI0010FEB735|nr:hypothetical protein [Helicobacter sp. MIT 05-5294]TLD84985.1 hypothetical protein LS69_009780 [Helicobacter sp. MIT 05-5294]